jgi:hypothetical protein
MEPLKLNSQNINDPKEMGKWTKLCIFKGRRPNG